MAKEIEYKFLVTKLDEVEKLTPIKYEEILQSYLTDPASKANIRVRQSTHSNGEKDAWITVKGPARGMIRDEWEYQIPPSEAESIALLRKGIEIKKTRYCFQHGAHVIELDIFEGQLAGLVVAEIEVNSENEVVDFPSWFGKDVTMDPRYTNLYLSQHGLP